LNQLTKSIIQTVIFGSIGALILYFLWQSLSASYVEDCTLKGISQENCSLLDKLLSDFRSTNYSWLIIMCIAYMISCLFRALRWVMLFEPMGFKVRKDNAFYTVMVGYFANLGLPRMGELIRAGLFSRYEKVPYEKVLGTIVLGRIIDFACLLSLIGVGLILHRNTMLSYIEDNLSINPTMILVLGLLGFAAFVGLIFAYRYLSRVNSSSTLFLKVQKLVKGFVEGMISLKSVRNLPLFIFYSVGIWFLYVAMHWMGFLSFGPTEHLNLSESLLCFDFAALGMVFPSPGGMGSYHAMLVEALRILKINQVSAFSIAMITFFTINIFCNILFGLMSLLILPLVNKNGGSHT